MKLDIIVASPEAECIEGIYWTIECDIKLGKHWLLRSQLGNFNTEGEAKEALDFLKTLE